MLGSVCNAYPRSSLESPPWIVMGLGHVTVWSVGPPSCARCRVSMRAGWAIQSVFPSESDLCLRASLMHLHGLKISRRVAPNKSIILRAGQSVLHDPRFQCCGLCFLVCGACACGGWCRMAGFGMGWGVEGRLRNQRLPPILAGLRSLHHLTSMY